MTSIKNTGDWNTGDCNTQIPKVRIFNQETEVKRENIVFPDFFHFELIEWISDADMTEQEKDTNPNYTIMGGYLKKYDYKEAWKKSWDNAMEEDRQKLFKLPNFDAAIFFEISGIDVRDYNEANSKKDYIREQIDYLQEQINVLRAKIIVLGGRHNE